MTRKMRTTLSVLAPVTIIATLWSLPAAGWLDTYGCCLNATGCSETQPFECANANGTFQSGFECDAGGGCVESPVVCCEDRRVPPTACEIINGVSCRNVGGTAFPGGQCEATDRATTSAATTVGNCRVPDGATCVDSANCLSGNCADGVCCDSACDGPNQACNVPGQEGVCSDVQMAPAASSKTLAAVVALLLVLGVVAMSRRTKQA